MSIFEQIRTNLAVAEALSEHHLCPTVRNEVAVIQAILTAFLANPSDEVIGITAHALAVHAVGDDASKIDALRGRPVYLAFIGEAKAALSALAQYA